MSRTAPTVAFATVVALLLADARMPAQAASEPLSPGSVIYRVPVRERVVALTFDDGPRPPFTNRILDLLHDQGVVATFFLIGENTERHPELARRIVREGHAIGNHGWSHRALDELPRDRVYDEIGWGARAIRNATGIHPRLLRPPYGALDRRLSGPNGIAADYGQTLVMWSVQTRDWATRSALQVAAGTVREVEPGAVVLLHDGGGNREHVVTATRWMLGHLARKGYRFVTVPELLQMAR